MWNLKHDIYETEQTHIPNRLAAAKGEGTGGVMAQEIKISSCNLLYTGWINNKVLLYSTEDYI